MLTLMPACSSTFIYHHIIYLHYISIPVQVQAQLMCTGAKYCDFIVYTEKGVHVERMEPDVSFMEDTVPRAKQFFHTALLPELLGRWFSRPS